MENADHGILPKLWNGNSTIQINFNIQQTKITTKKNRKLNHLCYHSVIAMVSIWFNFKLSNLVICSNSVGSSSNSCLDAISMLAAISLIQNWISVWISLDKVLQPDEPNTNETFLAENT